MKLGKLIACNVLGVVLIVAGILCITLIPPFVRSMIKSKSIFDTANSYAFDDFQHDTTVPVFQDFYIFNITNPEGILRGDRPMVKQFGPYSYRQNQWKDMDTINWHTNGTVEYLYHNNYTFSPPTSSGREEDVFLTLDMGYVGALSKFQNLSNWEDGLMHAIVEDIIFQNNFSLFRTLTAKEILWGYTNPLLQKLRSLDKTLDDVVSLQIQDDPSTWWGPTTAYTGGPAAKNLPQPSFSKIGQLTRWSGFYTLPYWGSAYANQINGTDATTFHTDFGPSDSAYAFVDSLYRSVLLTPAGSGTVRGVPTHRIMIAPEMFLSKDHNPDNAAFYMDHTGVIPIPPAVGQPVYITQPHFKGANASDAMINPVLYDPPLTDPNVLETMVYVEPYTGKPFKVNKRLQINARLVPNITAPAHVQPCFFPLAYIDQRAEVTEDLATQFKLEVLLPIYGSYAVGGALACAGLGASIGSIALYLYRARTATNKHATFLPIVGADGDGDGKANCNGGASPLLREGGVSNGYNSASDNNGAGSMSTVTASGHVPRKVLAGSYTNIA